MKALIMSSLLLIGALAVPAQYPSQIPNQNPNQNPTSNQTGNSDKRIKVQGCLSGSAGSYSLTDSSGQSFQLAGDTSKLSEHVGHSVEIIGAPMAAGDNPNDRKGMPAGAASSQPTLSVSSIKHISDNCEKGR